LGVVELFAEVSDPRWRNVRHELGEVLFIALAAVLCGAENCSDMADFASAQLPLLRQILKLEHGAPSHDTFSRIFRLIDPKGFAGVFYRFAEGFAAQAALEGVVAFDGKALKRCYETGKRHMPPLMVSAWGAQTRMTLAARLAQGGNEVAAVLELLSLFDLKGCTVTADALHCHRAMAEAVVAAKGDYALAVRANQPSLLRDAKAALAAGKNAKTAGDGSQIAHGREELRQATVADAPHLGRQHDFAGLKAVARVVSQRNGELAERIFLLSRRFTPEEVLAIVRQHWSIENQLHWVLDVVLDEDRDRTRKDNAPPNLAILRRLALNILRNHPDKKTPLRRKIKRAAWEPSFLLSLFANMR
jgi:predicted transposase YbfD/YdcC